MVIYLAGATTSNLYPFLTGAYDRYAAEKGKGREAYLRKLDEVVSAGVEEPSRTRLDFGQTTGEGPHILESFYYCDGTYTDKLIPFMGKFMLDSGAFTMFTDHKRSKGLVWEEYVDAYADFIARNKVERFFELDIDKLVGYETVKRLRARLERKAGRQCIPVWHRTRGKDDFLRMVEKYRYVAIGGIASKEIDKDQYKYLPWFINEAHRHGSKIHGLGFMSLSELPKCHFDSVDSTTWTTGNRFCEVHRFDGSKIVRIRREEGKKLRAFRELAINNFNEWVKFQRYAETHL